MASDDQARQAARDALAFRFRSMARAAGEMGTGATPGHHARETVAWLRREADAALVQAERILRDDFDGGRDDD